MLRLPPIPSVRDLIKIYGLSARSDLSQNFILDLNIAKKVVQFAQPEIRSVLYEIGCGPGTFTRACLQSGVETVIGIEKDQRFKAPLSVLADAIEDNKSTLQHVPNFNVVYDDALLVDESSLFSDLEIPSNWDSNIPAPIGIIGNLPFNIGTPLLLKWIRQIPQKQGVFQYGPAPMVLTFQKEVGDRITANPDTKEYGRLSVFAQYLCETKKVMTIPKSAFVPVPQVDSTVVQLTPRINPKYDPVDILVLEQVLSKVFTQRRKMIKSSINTLGLTSDQTSELLKQADINPSFRCGQLGIEDWVRITIAYSSLKHNNQQSLSKKVKRTKKRLVDDSINDSNLFPQSTETFFGRERDDYDSRSSLSEIEFESSKESINQTKILKEEEESKPPEDENEEKESETLEASDTFEASDSSGESTVAIGNILKDIKDNKITSIEQFQDTINPVVEATLLESDISRLKKQFEEKSFPPIQNSQYLSSKDSLSNSKSPPSHIVREFNKDGTIKESFSNEPIDETEQRLQILRNVPRSHLENALSITDHQAQEMKALIGEKNWRPFRAGIDNSQDFFGGKLDFNSLPDDSTPQETLVHTKNVFQSSLYSEFSKEAKDGLEILSKFDNSSPQPPTSLPRKSFQEDTLSQELEQKLTFEQVESILDDIASPVEFSSDDDMFIPIDDTISAKDFQSIYENLEKF